MNGRLGILKVHTRNIPLSEDVDLAIISRGTPGFAGADLSNLVNEAALIAARRNKKKVEMDDFEFAKDKVLMGVERSVGEVLHQIRSGDTVRVARAIGRRRQLGLLFEVDW
jgi:ATP-dependent Zn protease